MNLSKINILKPNQIPETTSAKDSKILEKILKKNINSHLLSGGTDLSLIVTKEKKNINSIIYMNSLDELNYIKNNSKYIEVSPSKSDLTLNFTQSLNFGFQ